MRQNKNYVIDIFSIIWGCINIVLPLIFLFIVYVLADDGIVDVSLMLTILAAISVIIKGIFQLYSGLDGVKRKKKYFYQIKKWTGIQLGLIVISAVLWWGTQSGYILLVVISCIDIILFATVLRCKQSKKEKICLN